MTSPITVRWVPHESFTDLATEAWRVLWDAGFQMAQWRSDRDYPSDAIAVAETAAGDIVGVVTIRVKAEGYNERYEAFHGLPGPRAFIDEIAVAASVRRQGVGRMLMRAAAEEIRARGGHRVALTVKSSHDQAGRVDFFQACGLWSLRKDRNDDLLGAEIDEVLAATATHSA
jgi:ribosomal protein S18 acetylase RimI-like enzyme